MSEMLKGSFLTDKKGRKMEIVDAEARAKAEENAAAIGELSEGNVPSTDLPHMQLVTDAEGQKKWEEKTHGPVGTIERGRCTWNTAEQEYPPSEFHDIVGSDGSDYLPLVDWITVIWDGVEYQNITYDAENWRFGTEDLPFCFDNCGDDGYDLTYDDENTHDVTVIGYKVDNRTLDPKYLPDALRKPVLFKDEGSADTEGRRIVECTSHTASEVAKFASKYQYKNRTSDDFPLTPFIYETAAFSTSFAYRTVASFIGVFGNEKIMFVKCTWDKGQPSGDFGIISVTPDVSTGNFYLEEYITFLPDAKQYVGRSFLTNSNGRPFWKDTISPILPSSTEGSTKKFKLTVDDSGTLTATEVTD